MHKVVQVNDKVVYCPICEDFSELYYIDCPCHHVPQWVYILLAKLTPKRVLRKWFKLPQTTIRWNIADYSDKI